MTTIEIQIEEKNKSAHKVDEPYGPEPIIKICLSPFCNSKWISNHVTSDAQCYNTQHIDPVIEANRQFPYIHFTHGYGSASHGLIGFQVVNGRAVFIINMYRAGETWVK